MDLLMIGLLIALLIQSFLGMVIIVSIQESNRKTIFALMELILKAMMSSPAIEAMCEHVNGIEEVDEDDEQEQL